MNVRVQTTANIPDMKRGLTASKVKSPAFSPPTNSPVNQILYLQRTIGNRAVQRLIKSGALQKKLRIGKPKDIYEQEADRVEKAVMQLSESAFYRQPEEEEPIQIKGDKSSTAVATPNIESSINSSRGEKRFLAHELTHVIQQTGTNDVSGELTLQALISRRGNKGEILQRTPAAPSYGGVTGIRDMSKIRIDAIADFLKSDLTAPRDINVHISDSRVKQITWTFYDPKDNMMSGSFTTLPSHPKPTSAPFRLKPSHFSGSGFVAGKYILRCAGLDNKHQPVVYMDRVFNVLSADLTTGTAKATTYGDLTFTKYSKTDATPPAVPRWSIDVEIKFLPKSSVSCTDVAFIQAADWVDSEGKSQHRFSSSEQDARKTPIAWSIDRVAGAPSPFYGTYKDPSGSGALIDKGIIPGKGGTTPKAAVLSDVPSWNKPTIDHFETCVTCRSGTNRGQVYGCATWGYTATAAGKVTLMPRSFRQMPSDHFKEALAAWNTWRMTKSASTRPEEAPTLKSP